jgi:ankyrin repeat protein
LRIHECARDGNLEGVREELRKGVPVESRDERDYTPLGYAAQSAQADEEMLRLLIESGADINGPVAKGERSPLDLAACSGSFAKVKFLLDAGADINRVSPEGYTALTHVAYALSRHGSLVPMVDFLLKGGAVIDCESDYGESPLSVASRLERFDLVAHLLQAGADPSPLRWTPLMKAVAIGSCDDVAWSLNGPHGLEETDRFSRTPLHLATVVGDIQKADMLRDMGANVNERDRSGETPLMMAAQNGKSGILRWLVDQGADVEAVDDQGNTALIFAARSGETECVRLLLEAGAERIRRNSYGQTAKSLAANEPIIRLLTQAGEDLTDISADMKRTLLGLAATRSIDASKAEFQVGRARRFGRANPEVMTVPFWDAMIHARVNAYEARRTFDATRDLEPVWCFDRFGMSFTELPDGRFVEIGGEHEDWYDTDFCIYNDVVIHHGAGHFQVLGYPKDVFPPTDFHSATLVGEVVYIIGGLGYQGERKFGTTPIYRLNCQNWRTEAVQSRGQNPGWIYSHKAWFDGVNCIVISEGTICQEVDGKENHLENRERFQLELTEMRWTRL